MIGTFAALRVDLVGTTADFRRFRPRRPLSFSYLPHHNREAVGRIGEVRLAVAATKVVHPGELSQAAGYHAHRGDPEAPWMNMHKNARLTPQGVDCCWWNITQ